MKKILIKRKVENNENVAFKVENGNLETVKTIIKNIDDKIDVYYTRDGKTETKVEVITETSGKCYLRSLADDLSKNNLDYLPKV